MNFYTLSQVAKMLHMNIGTARNRLSRGEAMPPSFKVGRRRLFPKDDFEHWISERKDFHGE